MTESDPKRGLKVRVDPRRCITNGMCARAAPGIYTIDEETGVAVLNDEDGSATVQQIFAGARACPTQAIIVEQFGRRVFPQILTPMWGDVDPGRDTSTSDDEQES